MDKSSTDFNKKITPLIDKMYQTYQFIGMSKGDFYNFILDGIGIYTFDEDSETSFYDFYTKAMIEVIHQYIKDALEKKDYKILMNFINVILPDTDSKKTIPYKKALSGLKRLDTFLDSLDFTLDMGEVTNLISTNQKLQVVMKVITDKDKEEVTSSDFSKYGSTTGLLVEAYCIENGLTSQDSAEDISDIDLKLDDDTLFSMAGTAVDTDEEDFSWEEEDGKIADVRVASVSDSSSMEYYNQLIRENPVLKPDEAKALFEAMKEGNSAAKDKLVYSNLRLVVSIAKKLVGRGVPFDDMVQEGLVGLTTAIERFDITKNTMLSTYATFWIRQAILRDIGNNGRNIRISIDMGQKLGRLETAIRTLTVEYGRSPRVDEIARKMRLDESKVLELYSYRKDTVSLNGKIDDEDDTELGAFVADPNGSLEAAHLSPSMSELIELAKDAGLSEKELDILLRHVAYKEATLEDLGAEYGVTRERIRQIEAKALKKILKFRRTEGLVVYTEHPETNLEMLRRQGPVRSNDTKSNANQIINDIGEEIKKGSETQQEASDLESPEKSATVAEEKTTSSATEQDESVVDSKKKGNRWKHNLTIFESAGISPADYYQYIEPQLSEYDKSIIEKKYGTDLENPDFPLELTRREKYIFNSTILTRVKKMATDVRLFGEVRPGRTKVKKTIFERIGVSSEDYYKYIEPRLTEKDRTLIKACYGENLEHPDQSLKSDSHDNRALSSMIYKLKKWSVKAGLVEPSHREKENKTIKKTEPSSPTASTNAPLASKKDNHSSVETVALDDKKNVIAQDSADVLNRSSIQEEIDGQRKKEENMANIKVKTIFEYLGVSSADYYQHIEPKLTEKDKALIKERYGEVLEHPDQSIVFSYGQSKAFYGSLIPRMKRIAARVGLIENPYKKKKDERIKTGRKDAKTIFKLVGVSPAD